VRQDLKRFGIPESDWYCFSEDRIAWTGVGLQRVQNAGTHTAQFLGGKCH